jgi:hypothetical protein
MVLDYVVGLYEAKVTDRLIGDTPKSTRQAVLEYLAANNMRKTCEYLRLRHVI